MLLNTHTSPTTTNRFHGLLERFASSSNFPGYKHKEHYDAKLSFVDILNTDLSMIGFVRILCLYSLSTAIVSGCCRTMTDRTDPVILSLVPRS